MSKKRIQHSRRTKAEILLDQRWATAYHEAGHAAAAYFLGLPFTAVHIIADEKRRLLGKLEKEPVAFERYPQEQTILDELERRIIISFAGMAAEAKYLGRLDWRYGISDFAVAFDLALVRHSEGSLDEVEAFLCYVWARAFDFMRQRHHWAAIAALAAALIDRERLTRDEAATVMEAAIRPLFEQGHPRSEVERLQPTHNGGKATDTTHIQYWMRRGLRRLA